MDDVDRQKNINKKFIQKRNSVKFKFDKNSKNTSGSDSQI